MAGQIQNATVRRLAGSEDDMITIGITGGVGCGKSKVLEYISNNYNCKIILSDDVANQIKEPGESCYQLLIELLGTDILGEDKYIDKKKMAAKIFADDSLLSKVNDILHPAVKDYILAQKALEADRGEIDYLFVEAALLIECGYNEHVDEMWYIYAPVDVRTKRLKESRGYSDEKIKAIMDAQLTEEQFREGSDFVIDNGGSLESTYEQLKVKLSTYIKG